MNFSQQLGKSPRVAIARCLPGLGDLLCAVPAFRALRAALPEAHITLIGLPLAQNFVARFNHYLDDWLEFPGYPGIPEGWRSPHHTKAFINRVQAQAFDLAIQMHGSGIVSNFFTVLLGAKFNAGFFLPGQYCPDRERFFPYPEKEPEVRRHLRLMEFLGLPLQGEQLEFLLFESDWLELQQILEIPPLHSGRYVCLHPGASVRGRRWSPLQFARVGDAMAEQGFQVILTGTAAEAELTETVVEAMSAPAINLAECTSLGALAALLKGAALVVCNDTGVSHLAAALEVKSVVIFSNSDPKRWAPLNRNRHRIVRASDENALEAILTHATDLLQKEVAYAV
ncbi:glycosyltransferase family 9 protein [Pleurocapsales cyanobacterium LEGE 06147]|nr:glycosyltransferase family 9 protein [Pleurocapsales cyanobacterium LEGE 06147]